MNLRTHHTIIQKKSFWLQNCNLKLPDFYDMAELIPLVQCGLSIYISIIWICFEHLDPEYTHRVMNNVEPRIWIVLFLKSVSI